MRCVLVAVLAAASLRGWENEAGGESVWRVDGAHSFLHLFIFSDSGWYRLRLFEAGVLCVCVRVCVCVWSANYSQPCQLLDSILASRTCRSAEFYKVWIRRWWFRLQKKEPKCSCFHTLSACFIHPPDRPPPPPAFTTNHTYSRWSHLALSPWLAALTLFHLPSNTSQTPGSRQTAKAGRDYCPVACFPLQPTRLSNQPRWVTRGNQNMKKGRL